MKKILTALIALTLVTSALFAGTKTYTAYTEHFDIVYTDKSVKAADSLYKNCEAIYDEVSAILGYEGNKHIPVYIDSSLQILNAYETQMPYNRIYLRDTTDQIGTITNQEDVFLGVFKHELTHALQFEIKPGWFIKAGSAVFGDWFSLQGLQLFPSYVEGTAVMTESADGVNGRLNNNLAMQRLKQAKLEGKFPSFFKAIGMRDTYPGGEIYYLFGGAFTQYLRETYGDARLQNFFYRTGKISLNNLTSFKFKKAFGTKQNLAWKAFEDTVEVPSETIAANALSGKSRFTNLKYSNGKLYVINTAKNAVYRLNDDNSLSRYMTVISQESAISFDTDGSFLVLKNTEKDTEVKLYSAKKALLHTFKGYRGGTMVRDNGKTYYALYRDESQNTYVDIADENYSIIKTYDLGWGVYASDFCSPMRQVVACIANIKGKQNIILINIATEKVALVDNPDNIAITSLNSSPNQNYLESDVENDIERGILSFSWTTEGSSDALVRYGQLNLVRTKVYLGLSQRLSEKDINGSIKYPVLKDANVVYIGSFYDGDKICSIDQKSLELSQPKDVKYRTYKPQSYEQRYGEVTIPMRKYQPLKYFFDGSVLPYATETLSSTLASGWSYYKYYASNYPALGLTYYTMDPSTEQEFIGSLGCFVADTEDLILRPYVFLQSRLIKNKITLTGQIQSQFLSPYAVSSGLFRFDFTTALRHDNEKLSFYDALYGIGIDNLVYAGQLGLTANESAGLTYQNLRCTGSGTYDYMGYAVSVSGYTGLRFSRDSWNSKIKLNDTTMPAISYGAQLQLHMPGFGTFLSHFSLNAEATACNLTPKAIGVQANVVPLCLEIQNGIQFLGLWFNRLVVDATYTGTYDIDLNKDFDLNDINHNVSARAYFTFSEAIGMISKESFSFGIEANWTVGQPLSSIGISIYNSLGLDLPDIKNSIKSYSLTGER